MSIKFAVIFLMLGVFAQSVQAVPIDLNDFYADPSVTVSADGTTALLAEDPLSSSILLSNHPGLGDPVLFVPQGTMGLLFDFEFTEGENNDDEFRITLFDANVFAVISQIYMQWGLGLNNAGTAGFDLSTSVGRTVGLQFELRSFDTLLDSTVKISNLRTVDNYLNPVPVPASTYLMLSATLALYVARRLRRHADQRVAFYNS